MDFKYGGGGFHFKEWKGKRVEVAAAKKQQQCKSGSGFDRWNLEGFYLLGGSDRFDRCLLEVKV